MGNDIMFIYRITNKINGKIYIGQTINSINKRWVQHCNNKKSIISKAIQKYGKENFTVEEIGGANSQSELNYLEKNHIINNNSLIGGNGYNIELGGKSKGNVSKESRAKMSISQKKIYNPKKFNKKIIYIETGTVFESIKEAATILNISKNSIGDVLNGRYNKTHGMSFKYLKEDENRKKTITKRKEERELKKNKSTRSVVRLFDKKKYRSITEAALDNKVSMQRMWNICNNEKTIGAEMSQFRYSNGKCMELKYKIVCLNNKKKYISVRKAAKDLGLDISSIYKVLNKKEKHTKKYIFNRISYE